MDVIKLHIPSFSEAALILSPPFFDVINNLDSIYNGPNVKKKLSRDIFSDFDVKNTGMAILGKKN